MATAPASAPGQLQAQVKDFTESYSHPDMEKTEGGKETQNGQVPQVGNSLSSSDASQEKKVNTANAEGDHKDLLRKHAHRSMSAPNGDEYRYAP